MIARRLRAAARLSQAASCHPESYPSTASTSYAQPYLPLHRRGLASSSTLGLFAPSPTRLKKKSSPGPSKEILADEDAFEEEDEEEDLFAISAEDIPKEAVKKVKKAIREKVPFQQTHGELTGKLQYMDPEESVDVDLRDWKLLVESASTEEDLKQCFKVARQWKRQTYSAKSKLQRLTLGETRIILKQARSLDCAELLFEVMMNRKNNGLDYDLHLLRQTQAALISRMGSKYREVHIRKAAVGSGIQSTSVSATSEQEGEVDEEEQVRRAKLINIDRTLILAASTSVFSPNHAVVDDITLLLAINGIIRSFKLTKDASSRSNDDFYNVEVFPRMARALTVLCAVLHHGMDILRKTDQASLIERCKEIHRSVELYGSDLVKAGQVDLEKIKARLNIIIGQELHVESTINTQSEQQMASTT